MNTLREHSLLHVIWCDDIRQEVGNKPSLMGLYDELAIGAASQTLQRLALFVTVYRPISKEPADVTLRVFKSDEEKEIALVEMTDLGMHTSPPGSEATVHRVSIGILLGSTRINETTEWLKVYAKCGDEELESLKLKVIRPRSQPKQA